MFAALLMVTMPALAALVIVATIVLLGLGTLPVVRVTVENHRAHAADETTDEATQGTASHGLGGNLLETGVIGLVISTAGLVALVQSEWLATAVSAIFHALFVIPALENAITAQLLAKGITFIVTLLTPPLLHRGEHGISNVNRAVFSVLSLSRVVEYTGDDSVQRAFDVDIFVIPALHQLGDSPLDTLRSDPSSRLVKDVGEVVLGKHGVGGVRRRVVIEDDVLLLPAALNHFRRAGFQFSLDLLDDRKYVGSENGEDKDGDLVLNLLDQLRQHRDLLDSFIDLL
jgi:hypothetical protein